MPRHQLVAHGKHSLDRQVEVRKGGEVTRHNLTGTCQTGWYTRCVLDDVPGQVAPVAVGEASCAGGHARNEVYRCSSPGQAIGDKCDEEYGIQRQGQQCHAIRPSFGPRPVGDAEEA